MDKEVKKIISLIIVLKKLMIYLDWGRRKEKQEGVEYSLPDIRLIFGQLYSTFLYSPSIQTDHKTLVN